MRLTNFIYVFSIINNALGYDSSYPRTPEGLKKAKKRVSVLEAKGAEAFYTVGVGVGSRIII
jgi:hypothetical protein